MATGATTSWTVESVPAFCITLERRQDRWRRFQDQPGINGLKLQRFLGVDGKTLDITNDNRVTLLTKRNIALKMRRSHEELDSIGGVGCALSHIAVWQWMVDHQEEVCIVFEDDAIVPLDFQKQANECIKNSTILSKPRSWDMWLLGGEWEDLTKIPGETTESGVARVGAFVLFHAYVLTLHGAKRLLENAYPIHCHIDIWTSIFAHYHDFRVVCCTKMRLKQNQKVKTDIQQEKGCAICNVPVDFEKRHTMVSTMEWRMAQASEAVLIGLMAYYAYQRWIK